MMCRSLFFGARVLSRKWMKRSRLLKRCGGGLNVPGAGDGAQALRASGLARVPVLPKRELVEAPPKQAAPDKELLKRKRAQEEASSERSKLQR
jgi:hypothetical protein